MSHPQHFSSDVERRMRRAQPHARRWAADYAQRGLIDAYAAYEDRHINGTAPPHVETPEERDIEACLTRLRKHGIDEDLVSAVVDAFYSAANRATEEAFFAGYFVGVEQTRALLMAAEGQPARAHRPTERIVRKGTGAKRARVTDATGGAR